jgi:hypothetical protein
MNTVQVTIKSVYGEDKVYPANGIAAGFAKIAGTKTLTRSTLFTVLQMGFAIEVLDRYGQVSRTFQPLSEARELLALAN